MTFRGLILGLYVLTCGTYITYNGIHSHVGNNVNTLSAPAKDNELLPNSHLPAAFTFTDPRGIRGVATYSTKPRYSATMHSVTLVSGKPSALAPRFSSDGSPKPSRTVTSTEKEPSRAARSAETEAIFDGGRLLGEGGRHGFYSW